MAKLYLHLVLPLLFMTTMCACTGQETSVASNEITLVGQLSDHSKSPNTEHKPIDQIGEIVFEIFEDKDGNIWFGTSDKGVARLDGQSLIYFGSDDGLCGTTVADIAEDKEGKLWFGTYSDMCIYNSHNSQEVTFSHFEKDGDVPELGWGWKSVNTDKDGEIWVNTHHGIYKYDGSEFNEIEVPHISEEHVSYCNTPGKIALYLIDDSGNMWFGTDGEGAYRYDGSEFTHFTASDGLLSNNVTSISQDKNGHILFACTHSKSIETEIGGLCEYDGEQFKTFQNKKGLHNNDLHTLCADESGNIWIGATGYGVYHYDGANFKFYEEPKGVVSSRQSYAPGLHSVLKDSQGRVWMGFAGGLYRLENETFTNITVSGPWK